MNGIYVWRHTSNMHICSWIDLDNIQVSSLWHLRLWISMCTIRCASTTMYMHPFSFKFGGNLSHQNTILLCWRNKRSESYSFISTITGKFVYSSVHYEKTWTQIPLLFLHNFNYFFFFFSKKHFYFSNFTKPPIFFLLLFIKLQ